MGHRLSKIYTKTGDDGTTGLADGTRVEKDDIRVTAFGTVDELNSVIGMLLTCSQVPNTVARELSDIQHDLFDLGGELSFPSAVVIQSEYVKKLEERLDALNAALPPLKEFILPGGGIAAATCHLARTVCRRAERVVVRLAKETELNQQTCIYLNRLSDYLFVLARHLARLEGGAEVLWNRHRHDA